MERCINQSVTVWRSDGTGRPHTVSFDKNGFPHCTCPNFKINRQKAYSTKPGVDGTPWCKHLETHFNQLCGWQGTPIISGVCDDCLGPTEQVKETEPNAEDQHP